MRLDQCADTFFTDDQSFSSQVNLIEVDLSHNSITAVSPASFNNQTMLQRLYIKANLLASLPTGVFDKCQRLDFLDLSVNLLNETVYAALRQSMSIRVMDLSHNQLNLFPYLAFENHFQLTSLTLSDSSIAYVDANAFLGLTDLQNVYLTNNNITSLKRESFQPITDHLVTLDVSGNPLLCDCDVKKFQDWLLNEASGVVFEPTSCLDLNGDSVDIETGDLSSFCNDLGLPTYPPACGAGVGLCDSDASVTLYVANVEEATATLMWESAGVDEHADLLITCRQFLKEPFMSQTVSVSHEPIALTGLEKGTPYSCCASVLHCDVSSCVDFETAGSSTQSERTVFIIIVSVLALLLLIAIVAFVVLILRNRRAHAQSEKSADLLRQQSLASTGVTDGSRVTTLSLGSMQSSHLSSSTNAGRPLPQPNRESLYDYIAESELEAVNMAPDGAAAGGAGAGGATTAGCQNDAFTDSDSNSVGACSVQSTKSGAAAPRYTKDPAAKSKKKNRLFLPKLDTSAAAAKAAVTANNTTPSGNSVVNPQTQLSSQYLTTSSGSLARKPRRFVRSRDVVSAQSQPDVNKPISLPVTPAHSDDEHALVPPREHSRSEGDIRINSNVLSLQPHSASRMTSLDSVASPQGDGAMSRSISQDIVPYLPPKKLSSDSSVLGVHDYQQIVDDADFFV